MRGVTSQEFEDVAGYHRGLFDLDEVPSSLNHDRCAVLRQGSGEYLHEAWMQRAITSAVQVQESTPRHGFAIGVHVRIDRQRARIARHAPVVGQGGRPVSKR